MSTPYDTAYTPAVPVLGIRLAAPGEPPKTEPLSALVDTRLASDNWRRRGMRLGVTR